MARENPPPQADSESRPRILVVTPEITYLPPGMGNLAQRMSAKAGGMADVSASLVQALHDQGADVHVALPNYRRMFHLDVAQVHELEYNKVSRALPEQRIHLAEDRVFYHRARVYSASENHRIALAFQREVINHILPQVRPQLVHCNDWMTGLIPAVAKRFGMKSLFTVHNIHTERMTLDEIEDRGIDAADFWQHLYYSRPPYNYEESRDNNPVDLLNSGIFAADHVNTVSPTFLSEVVDGRHQHIPGHIRHELWAKCDAGCATGILNAPDSAFNPVRDTYIQDHFSVDTVMAGKRANKIRLQEKLGLKFAPDSPLLFWPSRLDPVQKGCQLLTDILYKIIQDYEADLLQVAVIASGNYQEHFHNIVKTHGLEDRVGVCDFDEGLSHLGYAAADFVLMPSSFEPCGLPQMIAPKYGAMTIAHDTGGLHDTVERLDVGADRGNGFLFDVFDSGGLQWAIDEAIQFFRMPYEVKEAQIQRVMREAKSRFNHTATAAEYIRTYEKILGRTVCGTPEPAV
ncbi:glycogen synthase [Haloferula helveola]|uniref:starch synthase n=1 Tax=Haloferula helveola TaxID=490095 RepID=A0ABN6H9A5_9BACT|nr:glycogen synthase [Haloferula helveola]